MFIYQPSTMVERIRASKYLVRNRIGWPAEEIDFIKKKVFSKDPCSIVDVMVEGGIEMINLYPHQQKLYSELLELLHAHPTACIAADTGSGKTEMASKYIQDNPDKKVIIFAHNQRVLKKNFSDRLAKHNIPHTTNVQDFKSGASRVLVGIPAGIHRHLDGLPQADTIIIDEAHEYYQDSKALGKKMYSKILDWHQGKSILLTATHFGIDTPKVYFSRDEALELNMIANIKEKLVSTDLVELRQEYFNKDGEIKGTVRRTNFIDKPAEIIKPHLKVDAYGNIIPTLIIAPNSHIAIDMYEVLNELGYNTGIDLCKKGYNKNGLDLLKAGVVDICIVKNKGILGFDYPDLGIVIDCSFSQNITRMVQSKRSGRKSDKPYAKEFIKLAPDNQFEHYRLLLAASIYIGEKENFKVFDGQYKQVKIPKPELIREDQIIVAGHKYDMVKEEGHISLQKNGEEVFIVPLTSEETPCRKAIKDHLIESGQIKQTPSGERKNDPYGRPQAVCEEFTASLEECLGMFDASNTTTLREGLDYIKKARGEKVEVAVGFKCCSRCKVVKVASDFGKHKYTTDRLTSECKMCKREASRQYRLKNPDKSNASITKYRKENPEKIKKTLKKSRQKNRERYIWLQRKWREENPEKAKESWRKYRQKKKEQQNADTVTND